MFTKRHTNIFNTISKGGTMEKSRSFYAKIYGERALITSPETKSGGEKFTYQVPTREMLRGIIDANYFQPTLQNHVDEVRIMKKIESYTQGTRLLFSDYTSDRSAYTYLLNVVYYVKFHFEWNYDREDLKADRNFKKHEAMTVRSLQKGGRRSIFLGTSECLGYIDYLSKDKYESYKGYYDNTTLGFGMMFNGFIYPKTQDDVLQAAFDVVNMEKGKIAFKKPEECSVINKLNKYTIKKLRPSSPSMKN